MDGTRGFLLRFRNFSGANLLLNFREPPNEGRISCLEIKGCINLCTLEG